MNPQQIVAEIFPAVEWVDGERGFMPCPGKHLHSLAGGKKDCQVKLNGAPTIFCFHQSCSTVIEDSNYKMRLALWNESAEGMQPAPLTDSERAKIREQMAKKRDEEAWRKWGKDNAARIINKNQWTPEDAFDESPFALNDPAQDWRILLSLFKPHDVVWIGEPTDSGQTSHNRNFRKVEEWMESSPCGHFTCPAIFRDDAFSRSNDNVVSRPFLVIESDTLSQTETCSLTKWLRGFLKLRAMLFTGGKSIHSWFDMPSPTLFEKLKITLPEMGCDRALFKPSQPVRIPGVKRGDKWQALIWFDR